MLQEQMQLDNQQRFLSQFENQLMELEKEFPAIREEQKNKEFNKFIYHIHQEAKRELSKCRCCLNDIKIYIKVVGTISAGKSTFLNSLIGMQLLPSKNQQCTQNYLFISYAPKIIIDNQHFDQLKVASEHLKQLQNAKKNTPINIAAPSIFHEQLPIDLRDRIILIDTPGINYVDDQFFYPEPENLNQKDFVLEVWINDYTQFDAIKKKIFSFLNDYNKQKDQECAELQKNSKSITPKINQRFIEKLHFVLNKFDTNKKSEDDDFSLLTDQMKNELYDKLNIYKTSADWALKYRIMNFGNEMAQNELVRKIFEDDDGNEFTNLDKCFKKCQKFKNENFIKNQDLNKLVENLVYEIKEIIKDVFQKQKEQFQASKFLINIQQELDLDVQKNRDKSTQQRFNQIVLSSQNNLEELKKKIISKNSENVSLVKVNLSRIFNKVNKEEALEAFLNVAKKGQEFLEELKTEITELNNLTFNKVLDFINEFIEVSEERKKILQKQIDNLKYLYVKQQSQKIFDVQEDRFIKNAQRELGLIFQFGTKFMAGALFDSRFVGFGSFLVAGAGLMAVVGVGVMIGALSLVSLFRRINYQEVCQKLEIIEKQTEEEINNISCDAQEIFDNALLVCYHSLFD